MKSDSPQRRAELAGTWYPGEASECQRALAAYDAELPVDARAERPAPRGAVVPHAGWVFSGALAHRALAELARGAGEVDTVVLFAGHMPPGATPTVMARGDFWTPLGAIANDQELAAGVADGLGQAIRTEDGHDHSQDNSFELQFPLLKHLFPRARLVALGAPPNPEVVTVAETVLEQVDKLGRRAVFVGSTDLTHYGPNYGWAPKGTGEAAERWVREENDPLFIEAALKMEHGPMLETAVAHRNACCPGAAAAAARCARHHGASAGELLRYGTSADIHRSSSFVGYAGIIY